MAYRARWAAVHCAEIEELRATPAAHKLRQTAALMASAAAMGWTQALANEDEMVRQRWNRLRSALRG